MRNSVHRRSTARRRSGRSSTTTSGARTPAVDSVPAGLNGGEVELELEKLFGEIVVGTDKTAQELGRRVSADSRRPLEPPTAVTECTRVPCRTSRGGPGTPVIRRTEETYRDDSVTATCAEERTSPRRRARRREEPQRPGQIGQSPWTPYMFSFPAVLAVSAILAYPVLAGIYQSLFRAPSSGSMKSGSVSRTTSTCSTTRTSGARCIAPGSSSAAA